MAEGWKWGAVRDEERKEHPLLIPYKELPESEKELDRNAALETIKMAFSFGLLRPEFEAKIASSDTSLAEMDPSERHRRIVAQIKKPKLTAAELRQLWEARLPIVWFRGVEIYRRSVDAALKLGEAFLAFDIAEEGLAVFKQDLRLMQLQALALARTGATKRANEMLDQLRLSGHNDEETLGILARTHKDFWLLSTDSRDKAIHLKAAYELYTEAYRRHHGYYSGINAAALGLICGDGDKANQLAGEVAQVCQSSLRDLSPDSDEYYWLMATLAESDLIRGDIAAAQEHYTKAGNVAQSWVILNRTRDQARLLLEKLGEPSNRLDHCFHLPRIVVCAGHMFDRLTRQQPRFPHALEGRVRLEVETRLNQFNALVGFSSLACGADMIFAEAILDRGGEINIVLPFGKEDFKLASVDFIPGTDYGERFERILNNAATVTVLDEMGAPSDAAAYEYCNQVLMGLALLKGHFLGLDVIRFSVWDGLQGAGRGGTEHFVRFWNERDTSVEVVPLDTLVREGSRKSPLPESAVSESQPFSGAMDPLSIEVSPQEIKAMLFADIKGYTKLSEDRIPAFVQHFLGSVAMLMDSMKKPPIVRNTWGDAIHCVFDHVSDAGIFALNLRDFVSATNWAQKGLPNDMNIRIALHAGPAFPVFDPVLRRITFMGSHVNRTARIEPVVEEGQICASQACAALSAADGVKEFVCDYVGQKRLAKKYGSIPVFLVRRRA